MTKISMSLLFLFCVAATFLSEVEISYAYIRPANPVMDYVPQNIGVYDTYYENFEESDCRVCHGASTAERHHGTYYALHGNCQHCHLSSQSFEGNCKYCHIDGGPIGNLGSPHHNSDLAYSDQCNACHTQVVKTNSVRPPAYIPTSSTPTPCSCENCHWPSGKKPDQASTYEGGTLGKAEFLKDWNNWSGLPRPTNWPYGTPDPKPIEANGPVFSGILDRKPYSPMTGTHHEIGGKVFNKCYNCHGPNTGAESSWDPNDPYLIRYCESCHSMDSLHGIREHVTENNIYRISGVRNQLVTSEEKCAGCHADNLPPMPLLPADIPVIGRLQPEFGPPGVIITILPAIGECWKEDPQKGLCSFGQQSYGDSVKMSQWDSITGKWNSVNVPIYSWSEHLIQIEVPGWIFQAGKARIKVHKENVGTSSFKVFSVRQHPVISSLSPSVGYWGQIVDIGGKGFGVMQEKVYEDGYGYSTYVELDAIDSKYRLTSYGTTWSDTSVSARLFSGTLLDVNTGNPVSYSDLCVGDWQVYVIIDYFRDTNGNGLYNFGLSGLDPGDELLFRDASPAATFVVSKDPYINAVVPNPVPRGGTARMVGANFGVSGTEVTDDGFGDDDGTCEPGEKCLSLELWNKPHTKVKYLKVVSWSNTEVVFKVPVLSAPFPKVKDVRVRVVGDPSPDQDKYSNFYRIEIIKLN
jgi:hypothetical protein